MTPKRPLSPFVFFSQEYRQELKLKEPDLKMKQIHEIVKKKWKTMTEEDKYQYRQKQQKCWENYRKERNNFNELKKSSS